MAPSQRKVTAEDLLCLSYAVILLSLLSPMATTSGYPLTACNDYFNKMNSCPNLQSTRERINCCNNQTGESELQCISTDTGSPDGISRAIYTCDETIVIPAGFALFIDPQTKEMRPVACKEGSYELENRSSKDVHSDHCTKIKTKCNRSGEIQVCDGGAVADDQCGCGGNQEPSTKECWHGLTADDKDFCKCVENKCPPGTARNVTGTVLPMCPKDERMTMDYTCYPISNATSTSPEPNAGSTSPKPAESDGDNGLHWLWLLLIIPGILVIVGIVLYCRKNAKEQGKSPPSLSSSEATASDSFLDETSS